MSEQKFKVVSNARQLPAPPPLRKELVLLPELGKDADGDVPAVYECELNTGEHSEFDISDQVFDKDGNIVRIKRGGRTVRFLAYTTRDGDGNRLFPTLEQAEEVLNMWGKSITNKLLLAANRVNYEEASSADEAQKDAEGKSEAA